MDAHIIAHGRARRHWPATAPRSPTTSPRPRPSRRVDKLAGVDLDDFYAHLVDVADGNAAHVIGRLVASLHAPDLRRLNALGFLSSAGRGRGGAITRPVTRSRLGVTSSHSSI